MTLDKHEMKLLLTAALIQLCIPGRPVKVAWLDGVFPRPGKLQENIQKLRIGNLITFDPFAQELRVLPHPGLHVLIEFQETPELFTNERPLDKVLAEVASGGIANRQEPRAKDGTSGTDATNIAGLCKKTPEGVFLHGQEFAPVPKPKPPDPPPPEPQNPSRLCGALRSLRSENFAEKTAETLRKTGDLPASLSSLKERLKGIKPLQSFEALSDALVTVETADEDAAYEAMVGILGGMVMEGGDRDGRGQVRYGDGGKWRNWWRTNRARTHRVLCALVEEIKEGAVKNRGARGHALMMEFAQSTK